MLCRVCFICASYRSFLKAFPMISCVPDVGRSTKPWLTWNRPLLRNARRGLPGVTRNGGEKTPEKLEPQVYKRTCSVATPTSRIIILELHDCINDVSLDCLSVRLPKGESHFHRTQGTKIYCTLYQDGIMLVCSRVAVRFFRF